MRVLVVEDNALLRHHLAFNHKMADKTGAARQFQRLYQDTLRLRFAVGLPVDLIQQQQIAV